MEKVYLLIRVVIRFLPHFKVIDKMCVESENG